MRRCSRCRVRSRYSRADCRTPGESSRRRSSTTTPPVMRRFHLGRVHVEEIRWPDTGQVFGHATQCYADVETQSEAELERLRRDPIVAEDRRTRLLPRYEARIATARRQAASSAYNAALGYYNDRQGTDARSHQRRSCAFTPLPRAGLNAPSTVASRPRGSGSSRASSARSFPGGIASFPPIAQRGLSSGGSCRRCPVSRSFRAGARGRRSSWRSTWPISSRSRPCSRRDGLGGTRRTRAILRERLARVRPRARRAKSTARG